MTGADIPPVALYPLTFVDEGDDEVLVGRPDIESYAVLSRDGAEVLRRLGSGAGPAEVAAWYERAFGEPLDVADFLTQVAGLGFVREAGAAAGPDCDPEPDGAGIGLRRTARALFSAPAAAGAALLLAGAITAMVLRPEVRPTPTHVFFTSLLMVVPVAMIAIELPLMWVHEFAHVLAGRRLGIASRIGVGRRLYFVVFQTTLTGLYSVPRRQRYLVFVAGMLADLVVFSTLVLIGAATIGTPAGIAGRAAVAAAYFTVIRFTWQFLFFIETDVHHVLSTLLGVTDLRGLTRIALRARLRGRAASRAAAARFSSRERAVLRWYAPLTVLGVTATVVAGAATVVPLVASYVTRIAAGTRGGAASGGFWDAILSLVIVVTQLGLILGMIVAGRLRRRSAAAATAPAPATA